MFKLFLSITRPDYARPTLFRLRSYGSIRKKIIFNRVFTLSWEHMPYRPKRPCRYPGCPHLTDDKSGYCQQHEKQSRRQYDKDRGTSTARGYGIRWRRYRRLYLAEHPLCILCAKKTPPAVKAATVVDHIIPVTGPDDPLFWDPDNHQPACAECHNIKTATEDGGFGNRGRGVQKSTF